MEIKDGVYYNMMSDLMLLVENNRVYAARSFNPNLILIDTNKYILSEFMENISYLGPL